MCAGTFDSRTPIRPPPTSRPWPARATDWWLRRGGWRHRSAGGVLAPKQTVALGGGERSGFHQWAGSYDAPVTDIIKVQEDIARSIATNLEIRLTTLAAEGFAARGSSSLQAYQLYLTAHYHYELATRTDNERAIELFRQAVAADGNFAPAYIGLASAYLNQESLGNRAIKDTAADAGPLVDRAEKIHSTLADL